MTAGGDECEFFTT